MKGAKRSSIERGWTEVRVDVPAGWHELVAEALAFGPCTTIALGTTSIAATQPRAGFEAVRTFVHAREDSESLRSGVQQRLDSLVAAVGDPELCDLRAQFKELPAEDYATSWRKSWKPFRVGRLVLLPPWRDEDPPRTSDIRLSIEPGGSFGSGRHATTRTCLRVLNRRITGRERVLDAGSGSGILSVAAVLLGAESAIGFDVDPAARPSGESLAGDNGAGSRCSFRHGDFSCLEANDTGFDVVLANIYADILQAEARQLASRLAAGGWFAFSGCRVDHQAPTESAIEAAGLRIEEVLRRGRWITFVGQHDH